MKLRIVLAGLMMALAGFAAETGAELFQRALTEERAAGNLEEAIKLYQRIAKEFASDRALAAKALVLEAVVENGTGGLSTKARVQLVSGEFFDILGVQPALGRAFTAAEDKAPGTNPVAVLSGSFWRCTLGADPTVVGKNLPDSCGCNTSSGAEFCFPIVLLCCGCLQLSLCFTLRVVRNWDRERRRDAPESKQRRSRSAGRTGSSRKTSTDP